jgi:integrase
MSDDGLYLRGRTWWIRYRGPRPDGSWGDVRQSAKTGDEKKARKLLDRKRREAANARDGIEGYLSPQSERVTGGELLDGLKRNYETRKLKGLRQVKVHIAPLREHFGSMRAIAIKRGSQIDIYVAKRRKAVSDATIDRELELLRRAYTLSDLPKSFWPHVPKLVKQGANARQGFFEQDEFERVVAELPEVLRDVTRWAYATGMRRGEILSLTWSGYDRETKTIRLAARDSKSGKGRVIPLKSWPDLAAIIDRRLSVRRLDCHLIFHNGNGERIGEFSRTWQRVCERAKVRGRVFHDLRRTAVRNMIRAGIDPTVAKRISGHETDSVFERYNIVDEEDLAEALAKRAEFEGRTISRTSDEEK